MKATLRPLTTLLLLPLLAGCAGGWRGGTPPAEWAAEGVAPAPAAASVPSAGSAAVAAVGISMPKLVLDAELRATTIRTVREVAAALSRRLGAGAAGLNLDRAGAGRRRISPGQLGVLLMCEANSGINQTRLGKALGIDMKDVDA